MGEERLAELGIQRRGFLKKTAAAAFVAPAVVSFGLDGVADASNRNIISIGSVQCFANQTLGEEVLFELGYIVALTVFMLYCGALQNGNAQLIGNAATQILYALANNSKDVCEKVAQLLSQIQNAGKNRRNNQEALYQLACLAGQVSETLGCSCQNVILNPITITVTGLPGLPKLP